MLLGLVYVQVCLFVCLFVCLCACVSTKVRMNLEQFLHAYARGQKEQAHVCILVCGFSMSKVWVYCGDIV